MAEYNSSKIEEFSDIWVFCEQRDGKLMPTDFELISEGRKLADQRGSKLIGLLLGDSVAELAKVFGMEILAYDPFLKPEQFAAAGAKGMTVEELLPLADFISIHVPLTPETRHMFNKETIAKMKDGAVLMNMSRGGIVSEKDMYEALKEGRIGGYATDVLENEEERPGIINDGSLISPLFECENFLATPHMGAQTRDASRNIGIFMIEKAKEFVAQL